MKKRFMIIPLIATFCLFSCGKKDTKISSTSIITTTSNLNTTKSSTSIKASTTKSTTESQVQITTATSSILINNTSTQNNTTTSIMTSATETTSNTIKPSVSSSILNEQNEIIALQVIDNTNGLVRRNHYINTSKINVLAHFTDGSSKDISNDVIFDYDTTTLGLNTGTIKYNQFTELFNYNVVSEDVKNISIESMYKAIYKVNESFNKSDIYVVNNFYDFSNEKNDTFTYSFYLDGVMMSSFSKPGNYVLVVSDKNFYDTKNIVVYDDTPVVTTTSTPTTTSDPSFTTSTTSTTIPATSTTSTTSTTISTTSTTKSTTSTSPTTIVTTKPENAQIDRLILEQDETVYVKYKDNYSNPVGLRAYLLFTNGQMMDVTEDCTYFYSSSNYGSRTGTVYYDIDDTNYLEEKFNYTVATIKNLDFYYDYHNQRTYAYNKDVYIYPGVDLRKYITSPENSDKVGVAFTLEIVTDNYTAMNNQALIFVVDKRDDSPIYILCDEAIEMLTIVSSEASVLSYITKSVDCYDARFEEVSPNIYRVVYKWVWKSNFKQLEFTPTIIDNKDGTVTFDFTGINLPYYLGAYSSSGYRNKISDTYKVTLPLIDGKINERIAFLEGGSTPSHLCGGKYYDISYNYLDNNTITIDDISNLIIEGPKDNLVYKNETDQTYGCKAYLKLNNNILVDVTEEAVFSLNTRSLGKTTCEVYYFTEDSFIDNSIDVIVYDKKEILFKYRYNDTQKQVDGYTKEVMFYPGQDYSKYMIDPEGQSVYYCAYYIVGVLDNRDFAVIALDKLKDRTNDICYICDEGYEMLTRGNDAYIEKSFDGSYDYYDGVISRCEESFHYVRLLAKWVTSKTQCTINPVITNNNDGTITIDFTGLSTNGLYGAYTSKGLRNQISDNLVVTVNLVDGKYEDRIMLLYRTSYPSPNYNGIYFDINFSL